ncbi:MAG: hypothetical protein ACK49O_01350 [Bacteroidota bacterium]
MRVPKGLFFIVFLSLSLALSSCFKDALEEIEGIKSIEASPEFAVPLVDASLSISRLYNENSAAGFLETDSNNFMTFLFADSDSLSPRQLVKIPDVNLGYELKMDAGMLAQFDALGRFSSTFSSYAVFKTANKERLKSYRIRKGSFIVNISSRFRHNTTLITTYPTITKNGFPLIDTIRAIYNGQLPQVVNKTIVLDGYDVDLSDGGISYNVVPYLLELDIVKNQGQPVDVNDLITVTETFDIDEYSFIKGYLGKINIINTSENTSLDIFDKQIEHNLFLNDPKLVFRLENAIGMPLTCKISNLVVTSASGQDFPVTFDPIKYTFTLAYHLRIGDSIYSEYIIDKNNSNIDSLISTAPQNIKYYLEFTANYLERSSEDNFLIWDNAFKVSSEARVPLDLKVLNYAIKSSGTLSPITDVDLKPDPGIDLNLGQNGATLSFIAENYLPFEANFQIDFRKKAVINGKDSSISLLLLPSKPSKIIGSTVDANGNIIRPGESFNDLSLTKEQFDLLRQCDSYDLITRAATSNSNGSFPFVKVYSNQYLRLRAGFKGNVKVKSRI